MVGRYPFLSVENFSAVMHGLGSILGGLFRRLVLPFVKTHGKKMLASAVKTGMQVADDVMEGQNFKESAKRRVPEAIKRTVHNLSLVPASRREDVLREDRTISLHDGFRTRAVV